jgi:hypothetical protein
MDEQKRRVIEAARKTLEATSDVEADMTRRLLNSPLEDPLKEWRAWHAERDRQRAAGRAELKRKERAMMADMQTELEQLIDARVAAAVEAEREVTRALLTEIATKIFQRIDAATAKLEKTLRPLADDGGNVIDLPPWRRRAN